LRILTPRSAACGVRTSTGSRRIGVIMGRPCILCCILLIASFGHSEAQITTGSIVGTVKDTSRGVLPGVTVTAVNVDTTFTRSETSYFSAQNSDPKSLTA
jgi:hypothetical protein